MNTRGQVKWFDPKKGFGFIVGPQGQDVFVHYTQIQGEGFRSLKDGETVDYELIQGDKGWQARAVTRTNPPTPASAVSRGFTNARSNGKNLPRENPSSGYSNQQIGSYNRNNTF